MKITKFKLIDEGHGGIVIEANEFHSAGVFKIVDKVKRERKIMLSDALIDEVRKLKYFFLNLTGHWIPPYSQYYDAELKKITSLNSDSTKTHILLKELWNKVEITGAKASENGFLLTGKIETVLGKFMGLSTPFVTDEDDIGFYTEAMEVLNRIADGINSYFETSAVPIEGEAKQLSLEMTAGKTNEEIAALVEKNLMDKGAIIMMGEPMEAIESNEPIVHKSNGSIDGESLPEGKEEEKENWTDKGSDEENKEENKEEPVESGETPVEQTDDAIIPEPEHEVPFVATVTKVDPFGPPASEGEFPVDTSGDVPVPKESNAEPAPNDLSSFEHSENMGTQTKDEEDEEDNEPW